MTTTGEIVSPGGQGLVSEHEANKPTASVLTPPEAALGSLTKSRPLSVLTRGACSSAYEYNRGGGFARDWSGGTTGDRLAGLFPTH
jgi:hypothetical protein